MVEAAGDVRAQVERARERLADDVQALAHQANLPRRLRDRMSGSVDGARRALDPQWRVAMMHAGMDDIRRGRRSTGLRKLGLALRGPALVAASATAATAAASGGVRRAFPRPIAARSAASNGSRPTAARARAGQVLGLVGRPSLVAVMHYRRSASRGARPRPGTSSATPPSARSPRSPPSGRTTASTARRLRLPAIDDLRVRGGQPAVRPEASAR